MLLPPKERALFESVGAAADAPRARRLLYVGSYRPTKGQLAFLKRIEAASLGAYVLEFFGVRQPDAGDDWTAMDAVARAKFPAGAVRLRGERISHDALMAEMTTAAGLVHFSSGDRNPRVLYRRRCRR